MQLLDASREGDLAKVKALLKQFQTNVDTVEYRYGGSFTEGLTPLMYAGKQCLLVLQGT